MSDFVPYVLKNELGTYVYLKDEEYFVDPTDESVDIFRSTKDNSIIGVRFKKAIPNLGYA